MNGSAVINAEPEPRVRAGASWPARLTTMEGWRAYPALFLGSVLESTLAPWPIEAPLLAVMLRGRAHVFPAAFIVVLGSIVGCVIAFVASAALLQYAIGHVVDAAALEAAQTRLEARGGWAVFFGMMTPVPVQVTSAAAGLAGLSFSSFLLAASTGRTIRYLSMAVLVFWWGPAIRSWWASLPTWMTRAGIIVMTLSFAVLLWWSLF